MTTLPTWKSTSITIVTRSHAPTWTKSTEIQTLWSKILIISVPMERSNSWRAGLRLKESCLCIYPSKTTNRSAQMGATQCNSLCLPTTLLNAWVNLHQSPSKKPSNVLVSTPKSTHLNISSPEEKIWARGLQMGQGDHCKPWYKGHVSSVPIQSSKGCCLILCLAPIAFPARENWEMLRRIEIQYGEHYRELQRQTLWLWCRP